jgi:hypothetical protein
MKETGIPCFRCKKRSGIDCPGRKDDEATLCDPCYQIQRLKDEYEQAAHLLKCLDEGMFDEKKFYEFLDPEDDFFAKMEKAYAEMTPEEIAEEKKLIEDWDCTVGDGLEDEVWEEK